MLSLYTSRTPKSRILFEENKNYMPYGVSSNYRYFDPYPIYLTKGKGSRVWDVDGNEYIDFNLGFGVLEVGHANERIIEEVDNAIKEGSILGFEYCKTGKLAKIISQRYKLDMVRFSSTGTEATMHAIRFARAYTKRKKIIKFEGHYHGSHDQLLVNVNPLKPGSKVPSSLGIPEEAIANTIVTDWNDIESFEKVANEDVAAVIMEPVAMNMGLIPTDEEFLKAVFELSKEKGFLVIFDETKTGGKFYSGALGYFNVKPDLVILGKAIAGGLPLSVIGGKREIMELIGPGKVAHGGTFNANPLSVRASIVTLTEILTESSFYYMHRLSEMLERGYREIAEDLGVELSVYRWGPSGSIYFSPKVPRNYKEFISIDFSPWFTYFYTTLAKGVIPMGGFNEEWTVSIKHTEEDIRKHLEAAEEGIRKAKEIKTNMPIDESF
ncbi:aspartate aminotransferase family protein [Acidianus ambivalens]|uniref:Aminotransferase class III-fold pyridoxal phosphate-dependent enzyme n=1 Tax=Acidianus ambivalens TaxID=2283 RepID=A0A650CWF6_ACIAM|nr:aspartate aminotransferase family protein [Acidianus ambivalens]MQL54402.1 aminotransferase class III-fold pyridoxal phosphate-dependent enzyme [Acidianus ambivalens]QGR22224.1 aminotransferase class III-fold pyridoxal phosphate-dependent enzyme [Acidianus ambivalens]